ncbi:MAG: hypothetical protein AAGD32_00695 [Planctomycetota bacterium]
MNGTSERVRGAVKAVGLTALLCFVGMGGPVALAETTREQPSAAELAERAAEAAERAEQAAKEARRAAEAARRAAGQEVEAPEPPASDAEKFIKFNDRGNGGELQTSIVTYRNADGVTVDLIGAVHIGDRAYFETLNDRFPAYDSLLYELVLPEGAAPPRAGGQRQFDLDASMIGNLQVLMKQALELDFQLDRIDYHKPNFVHADLDAATFTRLQQDRNETFLDLFIKAMLNPPTQEEMAQMEQLDFMELLQAMQAPDRARQLKLLFAKQMRQMDQMTRLFDGPNGSVIIHERNNVAFEVLDKQIDAGDKHLGVFYGAAHLPHMEELLIERGFEQVGEPEYITAWDMTAR